MGGAFRQGTANIFKPYFHSYLSATIGSTRIARRAGRYPANRATAEKVATATVKVNASRVTSPNVLLGWHSLAARNDSHGHFELMGEQMNTKRICGIQLRIA